MLCCKLKRAAAWLTRGAAVSHTLTQAFVTRDPRKSDCREWRYSSFGICREQQLAWEAARDSGTAAGQQPWGRRPSSHFTQALLCRTSLALTLPLPPARRSPCLRHHDGRVGWISCHVPELSPVWRMRAGTTCGPAAIGPSQRLRALPRCVVGGRLFRGEAVSVAPELGRPSLGDWLARGPAQPLAARFGGVSSWA